VRTMSAGGATADVTGRMTKREMYHCLHAFRDGLWLGLDTGREVNP